MNGSTENAAHGAPEKSGRREVFLNLATGQKMLPLVQRIIADILQFQQTLAELLPEQEQLEQRKRQLSWPERSRRYQVQEDIARAERSRQEALGELDRLGLVLLEAGRGEVGFPTLVNGRRAYFSWLAGENEIQDWHFAEETQRRPVPSTWSRSANLTLSVKS